MTERDYEIRFPDGDIDLYSETFILTRDGQEQVFRIHDYSAVYQVPGLYEQVVSDMLKCVSYEVIPKLLAEAVTEAGEQMADLRVLDFGAGIGLVAAELAKQGAQTIVGLDIIPEAKDAAERDHPSIYHAYLVEDVCNLSEDAQATLAEVRLNCLACVSAMLGTHVSVDIFKHAFNLVPVGSWVAYNVNAAFWEASSTEGYKELVAHMIDQGLIDVKLQRTYKHRILTDGSSMNNVAIIGKKQGDL